MDTQDLVGKLLGNYVVEEHLGSGGMGSVYAARHQYFGNRVAIKVLHGRYFGDSVIAERFFREAKAAREINHPSVITVLDFGKSENSLYLVMELLEGHSLSRVLDRGALPERVAARIAAAIAEGLAAAHAHKVIHRDLKPDNIFVVNRHVKLLDFGIAKLSDEKEDLTGDGGFLGTPRYMSPEQVRASGQVGPSSDIYTLGVILFQMVTGQLPHRGNPIEVIVKILNDPPPKPSSLANVSPEMERLLLDCLAKQPEARPQSAEALRQRLSHWAGTESAASFPLPSDLAEGDTEPEPLYLPGQSRLRSTVAAEVARPSTTLSSSVGESVDSKAMRRVLRGKASPLAKSVALTGLLALVGVGVAGLVRGRVGSNAATAPSASTASLAPVVPAVTPPVAPPAEAPPRPISPPDQGLMAAAAPIQAALKIRSTPSGAAVMVDGNKVGTTPLFIETTLPFRFRLKLRGYRTEAHEIAAAEDSDHVFQMLRMAAETELEGSAPAKVPAGDGSKDPLPSID